MRFPAQLQHEQKLSTKIINPILISVCRGMRCAFPAWPWIASPWHSTRNACVPHAGSFLLVTFLRSHPESPKPLCTRLVASVWCIIHVSGLCLPLSLARGHCSSRNPYSGMCLNCPAVRQVPF